MEALRKQDLDLGGEQSGHVILGARNDFIGDGMVTALAVLEALVGTKKSLGALTAPFESMPQILINVPVSDKPKLESLSGLTAMVSEFEKELGQDGRILLRYSGTEKLARVMVEGPRRRLDQRPSQCFSRPDPWSDRRKSVAQAPKQNRPCKQGNL